MGLEILVALIFLVSTAAIFGFFVLMSGRAEAALRQQVEGRLEEMSGVVEADSDLLVKSAPTGPLPGMDRMVAQTATGSAFERWLEQSGTAMSLSKLFLTSLLVAVLVGLVGGAFAGSPWATGVTGLIGFAVPVVVIRQRRVMRFRKFEEHFPEALDLISRAVRAGHAFSAALKMIGDELDAPVGPEFRKTFDEQNFGLPLGDALEHLALRVPLLDVRFFVTAVLIQHDTGGNLAEILDNLAEVVRERFKIRRQVRVHSAHGRMTGYVLMALPVFLLIALSFINPGHVGLLFEEGMGRMMLVGAIVMQAVGYVWIRQVVKIEV
ncbi:MAG: type II secretion system F family protein [Vicinamibacterales bacterium]|jgi:tight adherence protein B|nr:type II secretion system F family protein [Vicinamibacterales bacterium]